MVARGGFADKTITVAADEARTVTIPMKRRLPGGMPGSGGGGFDPSDPFAN
jgi:hypothetical protein